MKLLKSKLLKFLIFWSILSCNPFYQLTNNEDEDGKEVKTEAVPYGSWRVYSK